MERIKREGSVFTLSRFPNWIPNQCCPLTMATISYDDCCFKVKFVSYETDLRAKETEHNTEIYRDSCMELFMQFSPDTDDRYINIEINPNGAVYCSVRYSRENFELIHTEDIVTLQVVPTVYEDRWELFYQIPVKLIQKYIPTYLHKKGAKLRGNLYKCGNDTNHPHYGCFQNVLTERPDFHRPEYFAEFVLD